MAQKTLADLCGAGATETSTTITITKSQIGLTGTTTTADQFILAIVGKGKEVLTETNFTNEPEQNTYISTGFPSFTTKGDNSWSMKQLVLNYGKPDADTVLDPNTY